MGLKSGARYQARGAYRFIGDLPELPVRFPEESPKTRIRLELTRRQKEQIRKATGRKVNALDLGLQGLPEPAEPARHDEEPTHRSSPATRTDEQNATGG